MSLPTIIGLLAAVFTTVSFVPQAVKIIKIKETRDISLMTYLLLEAGIFLWLVYGILIGNLPVILANGVTLVFTTIIVVMKIKFG